MSVWKPNVVGIAMAVVVGSDTLVMPRCITAPVPPRT